MQEGQFCFDFLLVIFNVCARPIFFMLFVRVFDLCLFGFVCFCLLVSLLVSRKGCGLSL